MVLTCLTLLIPAFSLPPAPVRLAAAPSLLAERSPTDPAFPEGVLDPAASVLRLSPVELSALGHSTSELLRTLLRVAASKPTSWLSLRPNFLYH